MKVSVIKLSDFPRTIHDLPATKDPSKWKFAMFDGVPHAIHPEVGHMIVWSTDNGERWTVQRVGFSTMKH